MDDANAVASAGIYDRMIFASGEPGAGKSEAVVDAAWEAAQSGSHVFIGCPTGVLVSGYLDDREPTRRYASESPPRRYREF